MAEDLMHDKVVLANRHTIGHRLAELSALRGVAMVEPQPAVG